MPPSRLLFLDERTCGQAIGDTLGIGGILRTLRSIPVLLDLGLDMERLCPDATFLWYLHSKVPGSLVAWASLDGVQQPAAGRVGLFSVETGEPDLDHLCRTSSCGYGRFRLLKKYAPICVCQLFVPKLYIPLIHTSRLFDEGSSAAAE